MAETATKKDSESRAETDSQVTSCSWGNEIFQSQHAATTASWSFVPFKRVRQHKKQFEFPGLYATYWSSVSASILVLL